MKKIILKTVSALLSCAVMMSLSSCSNQNNDTSSSGGRVDAGDLPDSYNADEQDLPYGATLTELKPSYDENAKISVEFDNRFFTEEDGKYPEIYKITDYMYALNHVDVELMNETFYQPYLEYAYKEAGCGSVKEYLQSYYDNLYEKLGDFTFSYIDVTGVLTEDDEEARSYLNKVDEILNSIESGITDKITSRKIVYIGGYTMYSNDAGSYQLTEALGREVTLYLYEIDNQLYVL
ncbi:MAG: hypothetical protein IJ666_01115 [Ruminococcus sp.]|nr:hypothetical protein [Ruminococcus sp.]